MVSRTLVVSFVLIVAAEAAEAADGFVSPVTEQTTTAFRRVGVVIVIRRRFGVPAVKAVLVKVKGLPPLVQVAAAVPVNVGKPVTEIKVAVLVPSCPVKLTVNVASGADAALVLSAVEAA